MKSYVQPGRLLALSLLCALLWLLAGCGGKKEEETAKQPAPANAGTSGAEGRKIQAPPAPPP